MENKEFVAIVQCHLVKQRCSGYYCESSFVNRTGGFSGYDKDKDIRMLNMTCGGCCGRALHRKLANMIKRVKSDAGLEKDKIAVQLSSCIVKDNYHGPQCPHLDYLRTLITKLGLDIGEGTKISKKSETRREEGLYSS